MRFRLAVDISADEMRIDVRAFDTVLGQMSAAARLGLEERP